ncbi:hypothetical protein AAC387_Pa09g1692 [Persea americana]
MTRVFFPSLPHLTFQGSEETRKLLGSFPFYYDTTADFAFPRKGRSKNPASQIPTIKRQKTSLKLRLCNIHTRVYELEALGLFWCNAIISAAIDGRTTY